MALINNNELDGTRRGKLNANFTSLSYNLIKAHNSAYIPQGMAHIGDSTPTGTLNDAFIAAQSGTIFGLSVTAGQILHYNGSAWKAEAMQIKTVEIGYGANLFGESYIVYGSKLRGDGALTTPSAWDHVVINVAGMDDIYVQGSASATKNHFYAFYSASDAILETGSVNSVDGEALEVPAGAFTYKMNVKDDSEGSEAYETLMIHEGTEALPYEEFIIYKLNDLSVVAKKIDENSLTISNVTGSNLFDRNNVLDNFRISTTGGITSDPVWAVGEVDVTGLANITIGGYTGFNGTIFYRFLNNTNTLISFSSFDLRNVNTLAVPASAAKFQVSVMGNQDGEDTSVYRYLMINSGTILLPHEEFLRGSGISELQGEKIVADFLKPDLIYRGSKLATLSDIENKEDRNNLNYMKSQALMNQRLNNQKLTKDINAVFAYGQSLSVGIDSIVPLSRSENDQYTNPQATTAYRSNIMLGSQVWRNSGNSGANVFTALRSVIAGGDYTLAQAVARVAADSGLAECPIVAAANALKLSFDQDISEIVDRKILAISAGTSAKSIEELSKESTNPNNNLYLVYYDSLLDSEVTANGLGESICAVAVFFCQGEKNYEGTAGAGLTPGSAATADKDTYKGFLTTLYNNMISDAKAVYGQEFNPIFVIIQTGDTYTENFENSIGQAQLEFCNETEGVVMAAPYYHIPDYNAHRTSNGYRWMGEYLGKVFQHTIVKNRSWTPVQPWRITKTDVDELIIDFVAPVFPLTINTKIWPQAKFYGFKVKDDNGEKNLLVEVKETYVRIRTTDFVGDIEVTYGSDSVFGGNLTDSDPSLAQTNYIEEVADQKPVYEPLDKDGSKLYGKKYPLQNWCVAFHYVVQSSDSELVIM